MWIGLFAMVAFIVAVVVFWPRTPEDYWRRAQQLDSPSVARLYFTIFLASHDPLVYELAHPDIHDQIRKWVDSNEPTCSRERMPEYVTSPLATSLVCKGDIRVDGITTTLDPTYSKHYVVTGYDSIP